MKWVKGKPADVNVIIRTISNKNFLITEIYEYDSVQLDTGKETINWCDVEWLDESDMPLRKLWDSARSVIPGYGCNDDTFKYETFDDYVESQNQ